MPRLPKIERKFAESIFKAIARDAFAAGHLTEDDLSDRETVLTKLQGLLQNSEINILVDHRQTILESAISYQNESRDGFSLVFYAMFFEHTINHLIHTSLEKKKLSKKTINSVIRTANLEAKFSWLMEIIGLPIFSDKHRKTILSVASERNAFVHYKWDPEPNEVTLSTGKDRRTKELLASARKAVTYLRGYESRYLFNKRKHKIRKVTGRRPNNSSNRTRSAPHKAKRPP